MQSLQITRLPPLLVCFAVIGAILAACVAGPRGWIAAVGCQPSIEVQLKEAAQCGDVAKLRELSHEGAALTWRGPATPLMAAILRSQMEAMRYLLEHGAAAEIPSYGGRNLVFACASSRASLEMVEMLLRYGADPNGRTSGSTPLIAAAVFDKPIIARRLLAAGARIDAVDGAGQTALAYAIAANSDEVRQLLLDAGATPVTVARPIDKGDAGADASEHCPWPALGR